MSDGQICIYFNGRDRPVEEGGRTCIGRAIGPSCRTLRAENEPVFADSDYAAVGSAVRLSSGEHRLYYGHSFATGFRCAFSPDGANWIEQADLDLALDDFGCRRMGLPCVRHLGDRWVMVFEGLAKRFAIYGATSPDGLDWTPLNGGRPLYYPPVGHWDGYAQANPSVEHIPYIGEDIFLFFNGCQRHGAWDLGVVPLAPDLQSSVGISRRLLTRRDVDPECQRLEGLRLVPGREERATSEMLFFALPSADSYRGGSVWSGTLACGAGELQGLPTTLMTAEEAAPLPRLNTIQRSLHRLWRRPHQQADSNGLGDWSRAEESFNDKLAENYFAIWDQQPIQRFTNEVEFRWIRDLVAPEASVLLIGSGGGREIPALLERAAQITALDISQRMLDVGQKRFPSSKIVWRKADVQDLPSDLNGFDYIIGVGLVFCYLPRPTAALRAVKRAVKPGGKLVLGVANAEHPTERRPPKTRTGERTRRAYSIDDIRALLAAEGFRLGEIRAHRFFVDEVPAAWNSADASMEHRKVLEAVLAVEHRLIGELDVRRAKQLFIVAETP